MKKGKAVTAEPPVVVILMGLPGEKNGSFCEAPRFGASYEGKKNSFPARTRRDRCRLSSTNERREKTENFFFLAKYLFTFETATISMTGSGKSTFGERVSKKVKVEVHSRDELGSTEAVKKKMEKNLKKNQSCIVDCCNMHPKDRIMWATFARQICHSCRLVRIFFDTPADVVTYKFFSSLFFFLLRSIHIRQNSSIFFSIF